MFKVTQGIATLTIRVRGPGITGRVQANDGINQESRPSVTVIRMYTYIKEDKMLLNIGKDMQLFKYSSPFPPPPKNVLLREEN